MHKEKLCEVCHVRPVSGTLKTASGYDVAACAKCISSSRDTVIVATEPVAPMLDEASKKQRP